jgi:hypothetical protein
MPTRWPLYHIGHVPSLSVTQLLAVVREHSVVVLADTRALRWRSGSHGSYPEVEETQKLTVNGPLLVAAAGISEFTNGDGQSVPLLGAALGAAHGASPIQAAGQVVAAVYQEQLVPLQEAVARGDFGVAEGERPDASVTLIAGMAPSGPQLAVAYLRVDGGCGSYVAENSAAAFGPLADVHRLAPAVAASSDELAIAALVPLMEESMTSAPLLVSERWVAGVADRNGARLESSGEFQLSGPKVGRH